MHDLSLKETVKEYHGNITSYGIGFILSLILTLISFSLVHYQILNGNALIFSVIGLGAFQTIIQVIFFLHLGREPKPKWETILFLITIVMILILVLGSLWVMYDLNQRVMGDLMHHD